MSPQRASPKEAKRDDPHARAPSRRRTPPNPPPARPAPQVPSMLNRDCHELTLAKPQAWLIPTGSLRKTPPRPMGGASCSAGGILIGGPTGPLSIPI